MRLADVKFSSTPATPIAEASVAVDDGPLAGTTLRVVPAFGIDGSPSLSIVGREALGDGDGVEETVAAVYGLVFDLWDRAHAVAVEGAARALREKRDELLGEFGE